MKKTQMIHSPRTFKLGLGLMIAAGLFSMPVLTRAADDSPTTVERIADTNTSKETGKTTKTKPSQSAEKDTQKVSKKPTQQKSGEKKISKLEGEAKKIAAVLTPSQRTKLLAMLNSVEAKELTQIKGVGDSRSAAITRARPIESIEGIRDIKGVGIKTLGNIVDHGKILTGETASLSPEKAEKE